MNYFIKNIHINKLFHLENIDIPIADEKYPHLIITGKNGSGKTVLLNAIVDYFRFNKQRFLPDPNYSVIIEFVKHYGEKPYKFFNNNLDVKDFVVAYYSADRKVKMSEPKYPTKPVFRYKSIEDSASSQFLNFLSDLKIQEALARNEKQIQDADEINAWFVDFEKLLQQIFQDEALKLEFNYKNYSFKICTEGKKFKFTELSDGFAAALDIVADLILKMQDKDSLTRAYEKEGIVLIDEIETHLHLGLQKIIMPLLTKVFPNIQFIVTTHSPFVLSSMPNAVAFDLEHQKPIEDLTDYSYSALAEGYFGVRSESSSVRMRLDELKDLLSKDSLSSSEQMSIRLLVEDFDKIPEAVSPSIVGEYLQMRVKYADKIKPILAL